MVEIDPGFLALPRHVLARAALTRAASLGATHADVRLERVREQRVAVHDGRLQGAHDTEDLGLAVRVVHGGAWGFASGVTLDPAGAEQLAESAVRTAKVAATMTTRSVHLAPEPVHADRTWVSSYDVDPLTVPLEEKVALLGSWTARLLGDDRVEHVSASVHAVMENKFYADLAGTTTTQQRVRIHPQVDGRPAATPTGPHRHDAHASLPRRGAAGSTSPAPAGTGTPSSPAARACSPRSSRRPRCEPGRYDLVIDPSNLWLTIHESIGHATELDRALGYEAALRRHLVRHRRPARHAAVRLAGHARHRRPDDRARPGHHRLRRRGRRRRRRGTSSGTAILVGYQLDRAMAAPARPRRPLQRLRVRRLARPRPDAADGQRLLQPEPDGPVAPRS